MNEKDNRRQLDLVEEFSDYLSNQALDDFAAICEVPLPVNAYTVAVAHVMAGMKLIFEHCPEDQIPVSVQNLGLFVNRSVEQYLAQKSPRPAEVEGSEVKLN